MATLDEMLLHSSTHDQFLRGLMQTLAETTKLSNQIPKGLNLQYELSFPANRDQHQTASQAIQCLIQRLLNFAHPVVESTNNSLVEVNASNNKLVTNLGSMERSNDSALQLPDDLTDGYFYDIIVDHVEALLDRVDIIFQQLNNTVESNKKDDLSSNILSVVSKERMEDFVQRSKESLRYDRERLLNDRNVDTIQKPQEQFLHEIDNQRMTPFRPRLKQKFHSLVTYNFQLEKLPDDLTDDVSGEDFGNNSRSILLTIGPANYYPHPYEQELLQLEYPNFMFVDPFQMELILPDPDCEFVYVDQEDEFNEMLKEWKYKAVNQLAIDLEHHSIRTFQGLTCLMQISTRYKDYIIDTLALRGVMWKLGEFFADKNVVKVLHGCDHDVLWLQRDFGLYIVNCFDTYQAARVLKFPTLSLSHLVKFYCGVHLDKKHQLSDWRQRPLSQAMLSYARSDTHYLLYIYHRICRDLWEQSQQSSLGTEEVLAASRKVCLARYEKPSFQPQGYRRLILPSSITNKTSSLDLTEQQEICLEVLWDWRDEQARNEDESLSIIMTNAELIRIGKALPRGVNELLQCGPLTDFTLQHADDLITLLTQRVYNKLKDQVMAATNQRGGTSNIKVKSIHEKGGSVGGSAGNAEIQVRGSVYTFTPTILSSESNSQAPGNADAIIITNESPVMETEEMFQMAGWKTPLPGMNEQQAENKKAWSPLIFEAIKPIPVSEENRQRIAKSLDELSKYLYDSGLQREVFEEKLTELITSTHAGDGQEASHNTTKGIGKEEVVEEPEAMVLEEIPRSFEEIYQLSVKNRKRHKDKKTKKIQDVRIVKESLSLDSPSPGTTLPHNHDVDIDINHEEDPELATLAMQESQSMASGTLTMKPFNVHEYFEVTPGLIPTVDTGMEATLNFVKEVGWVANEQELQSLKEEHYHMLSFQQQSTEENSTTMKEDYSVAMNNANSKGNINKLGDKRSRQNNNMHQQMMHDGSGKYSHGGYHNRLTSSTNSSPGASNNNNAANSNNNGGFMNRASKAYATKAFPGLQHPSDKTSGSSGSLSAANTPPGNTASTLMTTGGGKMNTPLVHGTNPDKQSPLIEGGSGSGKYVPFDYSKVAQPILGAMIDPNSSTNDRSGHGGRAAKHHRGQKSSRQQSVPPSSNPYLNALGGMK